MIISAIQPYFYPYLNYFNLFKYSDLVIILDNLQFPRRGWVHRNKFKLSSTNHEKSKWLTLPIKKTTRDTKINEIKFNKNSNEIFNERIRGINFFEKKIDRFLKIKNEIYNFDRNVINYLLANLKAACDNLNFSFKIILCSEINIDHSKKKENLILEIVKFYNAKCYINLPGGKQIYNSENFKKNNCELKFLDNYKGNYLSVLDNLE